MGFRAGDENLYRFEGDEPVNGLDPSGLVDTKKPWSRRNRDELYALPDIDAPPQGAPGTNFKPVRSANDYGTFSVDMKPYQQSSNGVIIAGIKGTVTFTPNFYTCPKCSKIKMIQVIRKLEDATDDPLGDDLSGTGGKLVVGGGWHVDVPASVIRNARNQGANPSIYITDWTPRAKIGVSGVLKPQPATFFDDAYTSRPGIRYEMEAAAICADTGKFLGSVKWGCFTTADKNLNPVAKQLPKFDGYIRNSPTDSFMQAVKKYNEYFK